MTTEQILGNKKNSVSIMEQRKLAFEAKLKAMTVRIGRQSSKCSIFSNERLQDYIEKIQLAKANPRQKKTMQVYHLLRKYDVQQIEGGRRILVRKDNKLPYVNIGDVYDIIKLNHEARREEEEEEEEERRKRHKGERRTFKKIRQSYANISINQIKAYIEQCPECTTRKTSRQLPQPPLVSKNKFGERSLYTYASYYAWIHSFIFRCLYRVPIAKTFKEQKCI